MRILFTDATTQTLYISERAELPKLGDVTELAERNEEFVVTDVVDLENAGIKLKFDGDELPIDENDFDGLVVVRPLWDAVGAGGQH